MLKGFEVPYFLIPITSDFIDLKIGYFLASLFDNSEINPPV
jgi:hypothetical protein